MQPAATSPPPRFLGLSPAAAAALFIAAATLFRFFYAQWLPLLPDEAYYLQWAQHLDASYLSKGPAVAWTIAAGTALWGKTSLGVRFFAVLLSAGTAWQVFLLARRWFDDTTGLVAVLLLSIVPLYSVGAVVMTIDPLSAFFWVWAANFFSRALASGRKRDWAWTGFAVGSGFLAKYVNALELLAFLVFLLAVPGRRRELARPGFWIMLAVTAACTTPVWWWNQRHGWSTVGQLQHRGGLNDHHFALHPGEFVQFLIAQAGVIGPLLFVALLAVAVRVATGRRAGGAVSNREGNEGEKLLLILFLSVFLFYALLAWHLKGEPNWPAVAYLSLIVLLAARWRRVLLVRARPPWIIAVFLTGWLLTLLLHDTRPLPLRPKMDPMGRVAGWGEIAAELERLRQAEGADVLIADAYKEASILSFHLPGQPLVYTVRHWPPVTQFDYWPKYPAAPPHRALWLTMHATPDELRLDFARIVPVARVAATFRGAEFRVYTVYRCENP